MASLWLLRICALNYLTGLAKGEIASLSGVQDDPRHFQISVPVQPGNSGGAVVNAKPCFVGVRASACVWEQAKA
jgi:S1-C subfamily serine protease